jgi:ferredoxin
MGHLGLRPEDPGCARSRRRYDRAHRMGSAGPAPPGLGKACGNPVEPSRRHDHYDHASWRVSEQHMAIRRQHKLVVDPIACEAHGLCAELLPEMIVLDDWGYPILSTGPVPPEARAHARRAVAACPTLALRLVAVTGPDAVGVPGQPVTPRNPNALRRV